MGLESNKGERRHGVKDKKRIRKLFCPSSVTGIQENIRRHGDLAPGISAGLFVPVGSMHVCVVYTHLTDRWMDGWTDGRMDGRKNELTHRLTDLRNFDSI
jgi:hypothetical protein